jgi:hypothetical protein
VWLEQDKYNVVISLLGQNNYVALNPSPRIYTMKTVSGLYVFLRDFRAFLPKHDIRGFVSNKLIIQVLQERNIDDMIRTPPHLLNQQNRKRPNMSDSTSICQTIGVCSMNPTNARSGNYNQSGLLPTSVGDSSSLLQSQTKYTEVVPQDGASKVDLPDLSSSTTLNTSATPALPCMEGNHFIDQII